MSDEPVIEMATPEEAPALAALIARAFADDPIVSWLFPAGADGAQAMFEAYDSMAADAGFVWRIGAHAMAMWVPPSGVQAVREIDRKMEPTIAEVTGDDGVRYRSFWGRMDRFHPDEPHWFLDHIAVDAGARGRGLGSALIRFGLERAAADGAPAYLETGEPSNVPLYQQFGLRVFDEDEGPDGGPHIWFMRLDP